MPDTAAWITALRNSHDRFAAVASGLTPAQAEDPSYDSEWTIGQVASHVGSGAEIFGLFLDSALDGTSPPGGEAFGPIWDRWNAKPAAQQITDSLDSNERLVARLEGISPAEVEAFALDLFGMQLDVAGFAGMRLGEHAVHTWDVEVAVDPSAEVSPESVSLLLDRLAPLAARSGKAADAARTLVVRTTAPDRSFAVIAGPEVSLADADSGADADLVMPAEAFLRLVYGRLDPEHTPDVSGDPADLELLRSVFPGF